MRYGGFDETSIVGGAGGRAIGMCEGGNVLVDLVQYKLPDGRQVPTQCDVRDDLDLHYKAIRERGLKLTCEVLMTGDISLAISDDEQDWDGEIAQNGPGDKNPKACLEKLIARFDGAKYDNREEIADSEF